jgi:hypothetical protein
MSLYINGNATYTLEQSFDIAFSNLYKQEKINLYATETSTIFSPSPSHGTQQFIDLINSNTSYYFSLSAISFITGIASLYGAMQTNFLGSVAAGIIIPLIFIPEQILKNNTNAIIPTLAIGATVGLITNPIGGFFGISSIVAFTLSGYSFISGFNNYIESAQNYKLISDIFNKYFTNPKAKHFLESHQEDEYTATELSNFINLLNQDKPTNFHSKEIIYNFINHNLKNINPITFLNIYKENATSHDQAIVTFDELFSNNEDVLNLLYI